MTTATQAPELSVVLPAFNEAGNIERVIDDTTAYLDKQGIRYEIHVVDDGSHDDTPRVLESLRGRAPALRVLRHPRNRGYGAALRTGLAAVRGEHVLLADGDGQFHIRALAALWARRHEADLVLGFRNPRKDPLLRRVRGLALRADRRSSGARWPLPRRQLRLQAPAPPRDRGYGAARYRCAVQRRAAHPCAARGRDVGGGRRRSFPAPLGHRDRSVARSRGGDGRRAAATPRCDIERGARVRQKLADGV